MQAVIFVGIQAAGKSTFYQQRFFATHVRISLDLLRTRHRERSLVTWCLAHRQPFVVDNTNPTVTERAVYITPARVAGFRVVGYYFESNVPSSIRRNAARSGSARVPSAASGGTKRRLVMPSLAESFDVLHFVRIGSGGDFVIEEWRDAV
jgi:predicted kinase